MTTGWKLVVGLGNPGAAYAHNRHNVGFRVVSRYARTHHLEFDQRQAGARLAMLPADSLRLILARPQTYMNRSGDAVRGLVHWYKIALPDLLVVYDDMDLPLGTLRLRPGGSAGGHHGMESIIAQLGTEAFARLRIGIGRATNREDVNHVLGDFLPAEERLVNEVLDRAVAAIDCWLTEGIVVAMNRFNATRKAEPPGPPDLTALSAKVGGDQSPDGDSGLKR